MTTGQEVDYTRWGLKFELMQRGLKQAYIAKTMGKDQAWVSKIVNGWIDPSDEDTERIAQATGISVDELKPLLQPTGQA
jgi:transcriptional regulator with XRE-family HTH domain